MKINIFDCRSLPEVIGDAVSGRTVQGDTIVLATKFNGREKPTLTLETRSKDFDKSRLYGRDPIDLTFFLPEKPSGKMPDGSTAGYSTWSDFVEQYVGPLVKQVAEMGRRNFSYEVLK